MPTDLIRYDLLVHEALRGVVRRVLEDAMREGLPGEHHYYVTFRTRSPGVRLSDRMRERYPEEMTIILQHQFWDLTVTEQGFEVGLSFSGVPERLSVPFDAMTGFFDPSVQFGLKFEMQEPKTAGASTPGPAPALASNAKESSKLPGASGDTKTAARGSSASAPGALPRPGTGKPEVDKLEAGKALRAEAAAKPAEDSGPKVVSIDAFRKKP